MAIQAYKLRKFKKLLGLKKKAQLVQSALLEISKLTNASSNRDDFYFQLHEVIANLIKAPNLFLIFKNPHTHSFEIGYYASQNNFFHKPDLPDSVIEMGLTGYMLRSKKALLCNPAQYQTLIEQGEIIELGRPADSWIGVPLQFESGKTAALVIQSYQADIVFTEQDLVVLNVMAEHISHAIERLEQQQLLEKEIHSRTKALQSLNQELTSEIALKQQYQQAQRSLLALSEQLDCSKPVSDLYQSMSQIIQSIFKPEVSYFVSYQSSDASWQYHHINRCLNNEADVEQLFLPLNEYFALDPHALVLGHSEIKQLIDLQALHISEVECQQLEPFLWLAVPLRTTPKSTEFIAVVKKNNQAQMLNALVDIELLQFLATHFNLIFQKWHNHQSLNKSNREFENIVQQRTKALNEANSDLSQQIEEREKAQAQLYYDANHDSVTKLPNRQLFNRKLMNAVARQQQSVDSVFVVLMLDLERFKLICDTFGHLAGDAFLVEVSQRILSCLHPQDILARLEGDEFVILLQSRESLTYGESVADKIIDALNNGFNINGHDIYAGCNIGLTTSEHNYQKPADVLRDADNAMYQAKKLGRGRLVTFKDSLHNAQIEQLLFETELRQGLNQNQFIFEYQPIINLSDNQMVAVETKGYWLHPQKGILKPSDFISLMEQPALNFEIDMQALSRACDYLKLESEIEANIKDSLQVKALVTVNIHGSVLQNSQRLTWLIEFVTQAEIDFHYLILEFCEASITDIPKAVDAIKQLSQLGIRVALDNFGNSTGSLTLLFESGINFVKLDHQLIQQVNTSVEKQRYAQTIIEIGKQVGFIVIADGISNEQMRLNTEMIGCLFAQGDYIKPAMSLEQLSSTDTSCYFNKSRKFAM